MTRAFNSPYGAQHTDGSRSGGQPIGTNTPDSEGAVGEVPEWAIERVNELRNAEPGRSALETLIMAFARYIAANEPAPVDPLRKLVEQFCMIGCNVEDLLQHFAEVGVRLPAAAVAAVDGER